MIGYGVFSGLTIMAVALAVSLSAMVSLVAASARRLAVDEGRAEVKDLCELTGITNPRELQDVFGPPDLGRVWRHVHMADIEAARRPLGHLISGRWVNWGTLCVAGLALFYPRPLTLLFLLLAFMAQIGGWAASSRLPR